eukprot:1109247_1
MSSLRRHISFDDQLLSDEDIYSNEDNHFDDDNHSDGTHSVDTHSNDNNPPPTPISNPLPSESDVPGFNIIRRNGCKIYPTGVKPFKNGLAITNEPDHITDVSDIQSESDHISADEDYEPPSSINPHLFGNNHHNTRTNHPKKIAKIKGNQAE